MERAELILIVLSGYILLAVLVAIPFLVAYAVFRPYEQRDLRLRESYEKTGDAKYLDALELRKKSSDYGCLLAIVAFIIAAGWVYFVLLHWREVEGAMALILRDLFSE